MAGLGQHEDYDEDMDAEQQALLEWFQKNRLERHMEAITDVNGDFGILSLDELRELTSMDLSDILDSLRMNIGERNRFIRGVRKLMEEAPPQRGWNRANLRDAELDEDEEGLVAGYEAEHMDERAYEPPPKAAQGGKPADGGGKAEPSKSVSRRLRLLQEALKEEAGGLGSDELSKLERELEAARTRLEDISKDREPAGPPEGGYDFPEDEEQQWFEVVKNLAFVKNAPNKDALGCGLMRKGQLVQVKKERIIGADGKEWVELTPLQVLTSCETEDGYDRGFMLIDGTHLGVGPLLRGPIQKPTQPQSQEPGTEQQLQQQQQSGRMRWAQSKKDAEDYDPRQESQRRFAEEQMYARQSFLGRLRERATQVTQKQERLRSLADPWRAVQPVLTIKRGEEPSVDGEMQQIQCNPGELFFANGNTRTDRNGRKWIEQYSEDHAAPRVWMLELTPEFDAAPLLVKETSVGSYIRVAVHYLAVTDNVWVFETFVGENNTVRMLRQRLCSATGLKPNMTVLMAPTPNGSLPSMDSMNCMLQDERVLKSCGLHGPEAVVYLSYTGDFEEHFMHGALSPGRPLGGGESH